MSKSRRIAAAAFAVVLLVGILPAVLLLALNFSLSFAYSMPPTPADWNAWRREKAGGEKSGLDWRSMEEVLLSCRAGGCRPYANAVEVPKAGPVLPLGNGAPNSDLVYCNETGTWKFVRTDLHGFNDNAPALFESSDYVLVGDSYATGACVDEHYSIAGVLRGRGWRLLNLGVGGHAPIDELGVIKEYMPRAKTLIWLYFEGNDHLPSRNQAFMESYLQSDFTQSLKERPTEILAAIEAIEAGAWALAEREQKHPTPERKPSLGQRLKEFFAPTLSFIQSFAEPRLEFDSGLYTRILLEGKRIAREQGVQRQAVVYIPAWERFAWAPRSHPEVRKYDVLRRSVADAARAAGFEFLDVTDDLYKAPGPRFLYPYFSRAHLNQRGYGIVADRIHQSLSRPRAESSAGRM